MDEAVPVGTGHIVVDLGNDVVGHLRRRQGSVDADAKAAKTVRVGRRHFDQGYIDRHDTALKESLNFAEVDGRVVGAAVINGIAHIAPDEHGVVPEVAHHLWSHIGRAAHGHHVHDFYV